jgi:ubiquinol-cytochrome c reductase cytochrome b/c1 subunit
MRIAQNIFAVAAIGVTALAGAAATAAESDIPPKLRWSFAGPFGLYDQAQLQRGFKVYHEVCQNCHGINLLAFRNFADPGGPGYSKAQAEAIAAQYQVTDGPNDQGEMFQRAGRLADYIPPPFPNEQAARARYNAVPPDFSTIAKARGIERGFPWFIFDMFTQYQEGGVDYITAYVSGYEDNPPAGFALPAGAYYNKYFPGHATSMPKPLVDGQVDYTDGTRPTIDQYAKDVSAFLMWVAEPHMEARKRLGFQAMIFMLVLAGLLYFTKKKVWAEVHDHA